MIHKDGGLALPAADTFVLADRIIAELQASAASEVTLLSTQEAEARLRDGTVEGMVVFPEEFTAAFQQEQQTRIDLMLEGANPTRNAVITARVTEAVMRSLTGLRLGGPVDIAPELPIRVETSYLFAGDAFDALDFVAPVYIAFLALYFVFLLTCVSFLRERSRGTWSGCWQRPPGAWISSWAT